LGLPKNSAHPNLGKLFVGFIASKEAQAVLQKYESRSSHLVEGTMMAKYLQENRIKVLDAKQQNDFYLQGEATGLKLKEELAKIMKQ
jgi:ABC-type Fe3+ transport system substrate-binding protein